MTTQLEYPEKLVSDLVDARVNLRVKELERIAPQVVTVKRQTIIDALKSTEEQVRQKHEEAMKAWKRAWKFYATNVSKNPGAKFNAPNDMPKLPAELDTIKAWIRAYECLTDDTITLSKTEWSDLFNTGGRAIQQMRFAAHDFGVYVSGMVTTSTLTLRGS